MGILSDVTLALLMHTVLGSDPPFQAQSKHAHAHGDLDQSVHTHAEGAYAHNVTAHIQHIALAITSTVQYAAVTVNGKDVLHMSKEGLHMVVLHPSSGHVMTHRNLQTGIFGASQEVPVILRSFTRGRVLVIVTQGDAVLNLSGLARGALASLGVSSAEDLSYRDTLIWVGTIGGRIWAEATVNYTKPKSIHNSRQTQVNQHMTSSSLQVETLIPIVELGDIASCQNNLDLARAKFCSLYDGYGALCSCSDPAALNYPSTEVEYSVITEVPLLVIAGNRPAYLYRSLVTVLKQHGSSLERILVVVDGFHQEVRDLMKLLNVTFVEHIAQGVTPSARISNHYHFALTTVLTRFTNAPKVIILEEDLFVAPDFFSYFS
ncbi:unnamed protein product, partial [Meganyctiphanes norvegica]